MEASDSALGLDPDGLKSLESTRKQLLQLINNLRSQAHAISFGAATPPQSLQAHYVILQKNLESLAYILHENYGLFQRMAVHPSTNFPGREPQNLGFLEVLLRRKLEPMVEEWVDESREAAEAAGIDPAKLALPAKQGLDRAGYSDQSDDDDDDAPEVPSDPFNEQWADIRQACEDAITEYITVESEKPYTREQYEMGIENVRTGLRRNPDEDEEDDEDDDDEDEDEDLDMDMDMDMDVNMDLDLGVATAPGPGTDLAMEPGEAPKKRLHPEHWIWFLGTGDFNLPRNIEIQSVRGKGGDQIRGMGR